MENPPTIFITGSGRSGTNITKAIFSAHSACATLPFEYRFTIDPDGIIDFINQYNGTWSPFMADKKLRTLETFLLHLAKRNDDEYATSQWLRKVDPRSKKVTPFPYAGWELDQSIPGYSRFVKQLMNQLMAYKYEASWPGSEALSKQNEMYFGVPKSKAQLIEIFKSFLSDCYLSILENQEKKVFVEDNTWSFLFARDLLDLVPKGKMIHIMRDPRDVIASLVNQRWTPTDLNHVVSWYTSIMDTWERQKALLDANDYVEIRLEDITNSSRTTISQLCDFVGLEIQDAMLDIDLSKSNSGRYKHQFTHDEIDHIEKQLSNILARYNY